MKKGGEPLARRIPPPPNLGGKMIIFTSVNLKEILKKRRVTHGSVRKDVLNAKRPRCGVMAMYLRILMESREEFGLGDTNVPSAARFSGYVPKVFSPDSKPL